MNRCGGTKPDVIIIGSGPAGVSAAWPLVRAGWRVVMVDAGSAPLPPPPAGRLSLATMRKIGDRAGLLGPNLEHLHSVGDASPKLRTAAGSGFGSDAQAANRLDANGFKVVSALIQGGLSSVWGAVVCALPEAELVAWPSAVRSELAHSYRNVAARIGLSGDAADAGSLGMGAELPLQPPLPLSPPGAYLRARGLGHSSQALRLGRPVVAVLSQPRDGRGACELGRACMWGCATGAVYDSAQELSKLAEFDTFHLRSGLLVESLRRDDEGWTIFGHGRASAQPETLSAPRVILAAGALASTRLALAAAGRFGTWLSVQNTPALGFALLLPALLGRPQAERGYGNAQLCFKVNGRGFGLLYDGDVISSADLIERMPLSRPGGAALMRILQSSMMLGLLYFPGSYSACRLRLIEDEGGGRLQVEGGHAPGFAAVRKSTLAVLRREMRRLGGWILPGSAQNLEPGAEVHVGASLPMGGETDLLGQLPSCPGLHVVDAAVLPALTEKHHTFTVMANADRIARNLSARE